MQIFVKLHTGKTISLDVTLAETIAQVKQKLQEKAQIPPVQQRLTYSGNNLADEKTLGDYDIGQESTLHLFVNDSAVASSSADEQPIQVMIITSATQRELMPVKPSQTVAELKAMIVKRFPMGGVHPILYHGQYEMPNEKTLKALGVSDKALINAVNPVQGGYLR